MGERAQPGRMRCTVVGCNPVMLDAGAGAAHTIRTGHRVAAWPVRSKAGKRKARARNRGGYYDRYNVGDKSAFARGLSDVDPDDVERGWDGSGEMLGQS